MVDSSVFVFTGGLFGYLDTLFYLEQLESPHPVNQIDAPYPGISMVVTIVNVSQFGRFFFPKLVDHLDILCDSCELVEENSQKVSWTAGIWRFISLWNFWSNLEMQASFMLTLLQPHRLLGLKTLKTKLPPCHKYWNKECEITWTAADSVVCCMSQFFQTCLKFCAFMHVWNPFCQDLLLPQYVQWVCCLKVSSLQPSNTLTTSNNTLNGLTIQAPYQRSSLAKLSTPEDRSQGMLLWAIDQHLIENEVSQLAHDMFFAPNHRTSID